MCSNEVTDRRRAFRNVGSVNPQAENIASPVHGQEPDLRSRCSAQGKDTRWLGTRRLDPSQNPVPYLNPLCGM